VESIRLQDAYLCSDCDTIVACAVRCTCGSEHGLVSVSALLNRPLSSSGANLDRIVNAVALLESALV